MSYLQTQRKCRTCGRRTLHARRSFSNGMGLLLSVLTLGLFIPVWLLIGIWEAFFCPWRCQQCGKGRLT